MQTIAPLWLWATFGGVVLVSLFIDFVVLRKQGAHDIGVREALRWSVVWIALSFLFNGLLWWAVKDTTGSSEMANTRALEFLTGYLIEKSLAVDNIFVFLMIFTYFAVPSHFQKRVLMIAILGAIVLLLPVSRNYDGENFWTVENGRKIATPLFMVICLIALTDVIFAVDSIPAIFAITSDPFIVLTSNVFAILGLRAMYFLLAAVANKFHLLNYGLAVILMFIGTKMCLVDVFKIPVLFSLGVVTGILALTMLVSVRTTPRQKEA